MLLKCVELSLNTGQQIIVKLMRILTIVQIAEKEQQ